LLTNILDEPAVSIFTNTEW